MPARARAKHHSSHHHKLAPKRAEIFAMRSQQLASAVYTACFDLWVAGCQCSDKWWSSRGGLQALIKPKVSKGDRHTWTHQMSFKLFTILTAPEQTRQCATTHWAQGLINTRHVTHPLAATPRTKTHASLRISPKCTRSCLTVWQVRQGGQRSLQLKF